MPFSCILLAKESQPIFAFEWQEPILGTLVQYTVHELGYHKNLRTVPSYLANAWVRTCISHHDQGILGFIVCGRFTFRCRYESQMHRGDHIALELAGNLWL